MKNYKDNDYALNRYREGIVYKFTDRIVEVTLENYLAENPDKTERDFLELKALSDEIYLEQDRAGNAQTKKNTSIHNMESLADTGSAPLDEKYIEIQDRQYAAEAISYLLQKGVLTDIQRRRFILHIVKGFSLREIARMERTSHVAILKSVHLTIEKIQKIFLD